MDYDDIDFNEDYSIRDINNNQLNSNMDYEETDSNSNSGESTIVIQKHKQ